MPSRWRAESIRMRPTVGWSRMSPGSTCDHGSRNPIPGSSARAGSGWASGAGPPCGAGSGATGSGLASPPSVALLPVSLGCGLGSPSQEHRDAQGIEDQLGPGHSHIQQPKFLD